MRKVNGFPSAFYSIEICSWKMPRHTHSHKFFWCTITSIPFSNWVYISFKIGKVCLLMLSSIHHYVSISLNIKSEKQVQKYSQKQASCIISAPYSSGSNSSSNCEKNVERLCLYLTMKSHEQAELKYIVASHCNWENAVNPWANTPKAFWLCDIATSFVSLFIVNIPRFVLPWPFVIRLVIDLIRHYLFIIYKMSFPQQQFSPSIIILLLKIHKQKPILNRYCLFV